MATPAMPRKRSFPGGRRQPGKLSTYKMSDGRQIEYTIEGERKLLEKSDAVLRVLNDRESKRKK